MIHSTLTPPTVDNAALQRGIAAGRRERSRTIVAMIRGLFRARPTGRRSYGRRATA